MGAAGFGNPDHVIRIPARDLRATRDEKLADLDRLLTQLQVVRLALLGQVVDVDGSAESQIDELSPDVETGRRFGMRVDLTIGMATETVQGNPTNEPRPEAYRNLWQAYGSRAYLFNSLPSTTQVCVSSIRRATS